MPRSSSRVTAERHCGHGQRGARAQLVERCRALSSAPDAPFALVVQYADAIGRGGVEANERQRVGDGRDGVRALANQLVRALALRRVDRAGHGRHVAAQLERVVRRDQRAALHRRLDDDRQRRQRRR